MKSENIDRNFQEKKRARDTVWCSTHYVHELRVKI